MKFTDANSTKITWDQLTPAARAAYGYSASVGGRLQPMPPSKRRGKRGPKGHTRPKRLAGSSAEAIERFKEAWMRLEFRRSLAVELNV